MTLAWDLQLPATKKLVLLAMCDWANELGICYPAMVTVARKTCISKRQCQRIMAELIAETIIAVIANQQGGIGSRKYQINLIALREGAYGSTGDKLSPVQNTPSLPMTSSRKTDDMDVTRTITNHQVESSLLQERSEELDWTYLAMLTNEERVVVVKLISRLDQNLHQDLLDELAGARRAQAIKGQWPAWLQGLARHAQRGAYVPNHAMAIRRDRQQRAREVTEAEKRKKEAERLKDSTSIAKGREAIADAIRLLGRG